jgi:hypothetical protein
LAIIPPTLDIAVDRNWTFADAVSAAWGRYPWDSMHSASSRTLILKTWGNVVGRSRALSEINALVGSAGSMRRAASELHMSPSTLRSLKNYYEALLDTEEECLESAEQLLDRALFSGETTGIELTARIPEQARSLAKEIAAFATSGGGAIVIGVDDNRRVVGLTDSRERIEGLIQIVQPTPTVRIAYTSREGKEICVLFVQKGREPIYYVDSRPYVRDGSLSRPAKPDEVMHLVLQHGKPA